MKFFDECMVDAGFVVETVDVGFGHYLDEVFIPLIIFGEKDHPPARLVDTGIFVKAGAGCKIPIETDDRLYTFFGARLIEIDGTIEGAVVGERKGVHTITLCALGQLFWRR